MFSDTAVQVLKRSSPRFDFANRNRLYGEDVATARAAEIGVRFDGVLVGLLEHNEMPDRHGVEEVLAVYYDTKGGGAGAQEKAAYGIPWNPEVHQPKRYRMYGRYPWRTCFAQILNKVPADVQERVRKQLRREGFIL